MSLSMRFTGRKTGLLLTQRPGGIAVRQRIQRVIQGRMHREMGRLFHHEGESVLVDHIHRDVVLRRNALPLRRQFKGDDLPASTRRLARMGRRRQKSRCPGISRPGTGRWRHCTCAENRAAASHPPRAGLEIKLHLPPPARAAYKISIAKFSFSCKSCFFMVS